MAAGCQKGAISTKLNRTLAKKSCVTATLILPMLVRRQLKKPMNQPIAIMMILFVATVTRSAAAVAARVPDPDPEVPPIDTRGRFDDSRDAVSTRVGDFSRWVDSFFDDPSYTEEDAHARVNLRQAVSVSKHKDNQYQTSISASVTLPNLARRWKIVFEGNDGLDPEHLPGDAELSEAANRALESPSLGLQYTLPFWEPLDLKMTAGMRFEDASPYVGPRMRIHHALDDDWCLRVTERLRWYATNGWRSTTDFDFDRTLGDIGLFRQRLTLEWSEANQAEESVRLNVSSSLAQPISRRRALRYSWSSVYWTRRGEGWKSTTLAVAYRSRIMKPWIQYEVAPFIGWEDGLDWRTNPGLSLSVSIIFEEDRPTTPVQRHP